MKNILTHGLAKSPEKVIRPELPGQKNNDAKRKAPRAEQRR
jgi:hypothetical protein